MTHEPADINLDKPDPETAPATGPRGRPGPLVVVIATLILTLGIGYWFTRRGPAAPGTPTPASRPSAAAPLPRAEPGDQMVLPPLDETDGVVRPLVRALSSHPAVAAWLATDGLIINFVVVTTRIANGETPALELKAVGPVPRFRPRSSGNDVFIDPASYRRYDRYADAVAELDARGTARLYATLKPRIFDAYARTGRPGIEFDSALERAIIALLRVPIVEGDVALDPHGIVYAYADPNLQRMTAAQKQLFRMGPRNVRIVQAKLREIATHLGIHPSRLPQT